MAYSGSGSGTSGDPYQITSWAQLNEVRDYPSSHFKLMNNLNSASTGYSDYASPTANSNLGWLPISFSGNFDGVYNEISDINIYFSGNDRNNGLFGINSGHIQNVKVQGLIREFMPPAGGMNNFTGVLVGKNVGTISRAVVSGVVSGSTYVGGIAGQNWGARIYQSISHANIYPKNFFAGGLVGSSWGYGDLVPPQAEIEDCYATGMVSGGTGADYIGGLVGDNSKFTGLSPIINRCYSIGAVLTAKPSPSDIGGLVGRNMDGSVSSSYFDKDTSGRTDSSKGTPKTTAEMQTIETFSGWDIKKTDEYAGGTWWM
jgi:hypothetical protein